MARILIIDDSRTVVSAVQAALGKDGHDVEGIEMLVRLPALLSEHPPDLILLDLEMPGVSGIKVGRLLKSFCRAPVPICVYSSRPIHEIEVAAREVQAVAILEKRKAMTELRCTVSQILRTTTKGRP